MWLPILDLVGLDTDSRGELVDVAAALAPAPWPTSVPPDELEELEEWLRLPSADPATTPPAGFRPVVLPLRGLAEPPAPVLPVLEPFAPLTPAPQPITIAEPLPLPQPAWTPVGPTRAALVGRRRALRRRQWLLRGGILVAVLGGAAAAGPQLAAGHPEQRVSLSMDGRRFVRTTRASTVGAFLAEARVRLAPGDRVEPGPASALNEDATVRLARAFPISVDVDGVTRTVQTARRSATALRRDLGLPKGTEVVGGPAVLAAGARVAFAVPHTITLTVDGARNSARTRAETVGQVLAERSLDLRYGDALVPDIGARVTDGLAITLTRAPTLIAGVGAIGDAVTPATHQAHGYATWYGTLGIPGTCAHLGLPMGTEVHITRVENGATATCRVADRGPKAWTGNIIDLAPDVFRQLGRLYADGRIEVVVSW